MNNKKFNRLVEIAWALYSPNHSSRCFHVTFILRKGKIQTIGINNIKTHTRNLKYDYISNNNTDLRHEVGLHSEMSAVIKGGKEDYSDCVFVNIRLNHEGKLMNSRPCRGCSSLLNQIGFKKLFYSNNDGNFVEYFS